MEGEKKQTSGSARGSRKAVRSFKVFLRLLFLSSSPISMAVRSKWRSRNEVLVVQGREKKTPKTREAWTHSGVKMRTNSRRLELDLLYFLRRNTRKNLQSLLCYVQHFKRASDEVVFGKDKSSRLLRYVDNWEDQCVSHLSRIEIIIDESYYLKKLKVKSRRWGAAACDIGGYTLRCWVSPGSSVRLHSCELSPPLWTVCISARTCQDTRFTWNSNKYRCCSSASTVMLFRDCGSISVTVWIFSGMGWKLFLLGNVLQLRPRFHTFGYFLINKYRCSNKCVRPRGRNHHRQNTREEFSERAKIRQQG